MSQVPRGLDVLLEKASVDPEFRRLLVEKRAQAARAIDLESSESEVAVPAAFPRDRLEMIVDKTEVKPERRPVLLGSVGRMMLAIVVAGSVVALPAPTLGHSARLSYEIARKAKEREAEILRQMEADRAPRDANDGSRTGELPPLGADDLDAEIDN